MKTTMVNIPALSIFLLFMTGCPSKNPLELDLSKKAPLAIFYYSVEADKPELQGNFGCSWCEFSMTYNADSLCWQVDSLDVVAPGQYLMNIEYASGRWSVEDSSGIPAIHGQVLGKTTVMDEKVQLTCVQRDNQGAMNLTFYLDEQGAIDLGQCP